jgi:leucyl-tRNA synthetase
LFDEKLAQEDVVEVPVQVNGRLRGHIQVAFGTGTKELEAAALANKKVEPFLAGKQVLKIVVVPDRLVNIVVK